MWTDRIASLSLPVVLGILLALAGVRLSLRGRRALFFRVLCELSEASMKALALIFLLVRPFLVQTYHVSSGSMEPGLRRGDGILISKLAYRLRAPTYGEVVVFRAPDAAETGETLKRIVGLPGDTLEARPGFVVLIERGSKQPRRFDHEGLRTLLNLPEDAPLALTQGGVWCDGSRLSPDALAIRVGLPGALALLQPGVVLRNGQPISETYAAEDIAESFGPVTVPAGHFFVLGDNRNRSHDSRFWGAIPQTRLVGRAEYVFWPGGRLGRIR
jgi:signal peptidase I